MVQKISDIMSKKVGSADKNPEKQWLWPGKAHKATR